VVCFACDPAYEALSQVRLHRIVLHGSAGCLWSQAVGSGTRIAMILDPLYGVCCMCVNVLFA